MKYEDLKTKSDDQLIAEIDALKREQFNLRFKAATAGLENTSRVKIIRRTIAKIKTLQSERTATSSQGA
jgi:large subunit ribosomal protein L29